MNLHIEVPYGENQHHVIEAIFKSLGRALAQAVELDPRIKGVRSSKGTL
jgi:imidazoleglycerol-phosphate dehydratase